MFFLLFPVAEAYNFDTTEEAETLGRWTIIVSFLFMLVLPIVMLAFKFEIHFLSSLTSIFLLLQLGRWTLLMNFKYSAFYGSYWKEVGKWLGPFNLYRVEEDPPRDEGFSQVPNLETSIFVSNTDFVQITYMSIFVMILLLKLFFGRSFCVKILFWTHFITIMDVYVYSYIQMKDLNSDSALSVASFIASIIFHVAYTGCYTAICYILYRGHSQFYLQQFYKEESGIFYCYYPFVLTLRSIVPVLLVWLYDHQFVQFGVTIGLEAIIISYLLIVQPIKFIRNLILVILYHLFEGILLVFPYFYQCTNIPNSYLDNAFVWMVWITISLCFLWYISDCMIANYKKVKSNENKIRIFNHGKEVKTEQLESKGEANNTVVFEVQQGNLGRVGLNRGLNFRTINEITVLRRLE